MNVSFIALRMGGCDERPIAMTSVQDLLLKQKPFVKVYGATGYSERLAANEVAMQMAWSGDVYRARQQNTDIKYVYPKEGVELWVDNLAIPAGAKNVEAAKKFITFIMKPENMAAYSVVSGNIPSIYDARQHLPEDLKKAPEFNIPPGSMTHIAKACSAGAIKSYNKIWETVLQ
jgi:spermidine/putrescine transport system substrate-binding protein